MLNDLSTNIDNQNENSKDISKYFEEISFIIKNIENKDILKDILEHLKPILTNLEDSLSISETICDEANTNENNTLLISELQNKVILPYTSNDIEKILNSNSKYRNAEEIIEKLYTLPLSYYKNAAKSRFKEGYNLMRNKEKASIQDSLSLAFEVCFNTALNPAIITACKNLDELDTYLDCLCENELDKFNIFNIKFEMLPQKINQ